MRLADWLKTQGMLPTEFATLVGVSRSQVSRWLNGQTRPDWDCLAKISSATADQVTPNDFLDGAEDDGGERQRLQSADGKSVNPRSSRPGFRAA